MKLTQEILSKLPNQAQAVYGDCLMYLSGDSDLNTPERKAILISGIEKMKTTLKLIESEIK